MPVQGGIHLELGGGGTYLSNLPKKVITHFGTINKS